MPGEQAYAKLRERIDKGNQLLHQEVQPGRIGDLEAEAAKWGDYNAELIKTLFEGDELPFEYSTSRPVMLASRYDNELARARLASNAIESQVRELESIVERLDLYPAPEQQPAPATVRSSTVPGRRVFIVHGKDEAALGVVEGFLRQVGLEPIVLRNQPNAGRTIIEKFEDYADVGFAVVILTPDDAMPPQSGSDRPTFRPRQNVIFEMGYFIGKLGRKHVAALYKPELEILSDYSGVLYTMLDSGGAWKISLGREMKQAGLRFNFDAVLGS